MRVDKDSDDRTKAAFNALREQTSQAEAVFGEALDWPELPERSGSRVCKDLQGGWRTPEAEWAALQDRLIETAMRLEKALKGPIQALRI